MTAIQAAIRVHSEVLHAVDELGVDRAARGILVELAASHISNGLAAVASVSAQSRPGIVHAMTRAMDAR